MSEHIHAPTGGAEDITPAVRILLGSLKDADEALSRAMGRVLSTLGEPAIDILATTASEHEDGDVRIAASIALDEIGTPAMSRILHLLQTCKTSNQPCDTKPVPRRWKRVDAE